MNSKKKQSKASNETSLIRSSAAEYLTFVAASGKGNVQTVYDNENVWLTQKMMGLLYDVETHTINYHLKKVFDDSELREDSVIRNFRITADDGKTYDTQHYNLSAIIAKTACEVSGHAVADHFVDVNKMVESNVVKPIEFDGIRNLSKRETQS